MSKETEEQRLASYRSAQTDVLRAACLYIRRYERGHPSTEKDLTSLQEAVNRLDILIARYGSDRINEWEREHRLTL